MLVICLSTLVIGVTLGIGFATAQLSSSLILRGTGIADQDDMTFWLHPTDLSQSTIITSDKSANKLFVYDLSGNILQVITAQRPGNIDSRYGFLLGGDSVDIVAFNERSTRKIRVYKVDPATRQLVQIDNGNIHSGSNYGFTLYKSPSTGDFYAFTGPESNTQIRQFKLIDTGNGQVSAVETIRSTLLQPGGTVEGMVADDETRKLYLSSESGGLWKYDAEPDGNTPGTRIAAVATNGLTEDVEGVTIYYMAQGQGYIIASSQGTSTFKVYERQAPHNFVGSFTVNGVTDTDGIDVINVPLPLNGISSQGIFALHNGQISPYPVEIVKWEEIASALGLSIDTDYRKPHMVRTSTNNPPVATDDTDRATDEDTPVVVHVLSNDPADPDGDPLRVVSVTQPSHGSATLNKADNSVTYTPHANFNGADSFTYTISDGRGGRDTATVNMTVRPVSDPPVASTQ
jgi:3-phytase